MDKIQFEKFLETHEMLEDSETELMPMSKEDRVALSEAFREVQAGRMKEMDYLIYRCSLPGTTRPKILP